MDGKVLQDAVIAPNNNSSAVLTPGQTLRIVDLEGKQAVDFLCYNADDVADRYNAADTMKYNKNAYLGAGHGIYTVRATKLFTIVADTMGGGHDTIGGCCSAASNMFRYKVPDTPSCYGNFLRALAPHGMGEKDIVANINFFMNVPVQPDGTMGIVDGKSKAGDFVDLRVETRVLAVVSNCPQVHNPCNGFNPTPIRVVVTDPAG
jgi:urea carboxylase-associated protein 1